jgi:arginyl-tRNA synthetase
VYTIVRAFRIIQKFPGFKKKEDYSLCDSEYETRLVMHLSIFPDVLLKAVENNKPSDVASYAYQSAVLFNQFYENCPVKDEENPSRSMARFKIVKAYYSLLERILSEILGIHIPTQM